MMKKHEPVWKMTKERFTKVLMEKYRACAVLSPAALEVGQMVLDDKLWGWLIVRVSPKRKRVMGRRLGKDMEPCGEPMRMDVSPRIVKPAPIFPPEKVLPSFRLLDGSFRDFCGGHASQVKRFLDMGKPVPEEVLREYEDVWWAKGALLDRGLELTTGGDNDDID